MKRYTESHEWIDEDGRVGVSAHALELLGDIVFIELPEEGDELPMGESVAVIESHKAASDIYAPVSGVVKAVNQAIVDAPEDIEATSDLWLFDMTPNNPEDINALMDEAGYKEFIESEA